MSKVGLDVLAGGVGACVIERLLYLDSKPGIVFRIEGNTLLKRRDQHGNRSEFAFDDHFRACADVGQQSSKVADGVGFRDVKDGHTQNDTSTRRQPEAPRETGGAWQRLGRGREAEAAEERDHGEALHQDGEDDDDVGDGEERAEVRLAYESEDEGYG